MLPLQDRIIDSMRRGGRGKVYTPKDFAGVASRVAVDQAFSRMARGGEVARLRRGLYYLPQMHPRLAIPVLPDMQEVASAIARQTGSRIVPSGAVAANLLGLSEQVPARPVYLTDGRSRVFTIGPTKIVLKHAVPKSLPPGSPLTCLVVQAMQYLGQENVDAKVVSHLQGRLTPIERRLLAKESQYATGWITEAIGRVAGSNSEAAHG